MSLLSDQDRKLAETIANLTFCNQFLPERVALEKSALGDDYVSTEQVWSHRIDNAESDANIIRLNEKAKELGQRLRAQLADGATAAPRELELYSELVFYLLYYEYYLKFQDLIRQAESSDANPVVEFYPDFLEEYNFYFHVIPGRAFHNFDPDHLFALLYQVRRAFSYIFNCILGGSLPTAQLRAAVWQSIFTHDTRRYMRCLYRNMGDINTLICGPSGTGKDLVARAIGMARYVPFLAPKRTFAENFVTSYHTLNISALSPTLVESELFGHVKGSFTGAVQNRVGHLEVCSPLGTIFLDEIGEIAPSIQVKLLRVLQERVFQRLGDNEPRRFDGKIIAATNKDLIAEMAEDRFRRDFYYRLCSDVIQTPSLAAQIQDSPAELHNLVFLLAKRIATPEECDDITSEVVSWIEQELGLDYSWPGNVRELEQCVRNIVIRKEYQPAVAPVVNHRRDNASLLQAMTAGKLTGDELMQLYCTLVYKQVDSYQEVARCLDLDRRTVKAKLNNELYDRFFDA